MDPNETVRLISEALGFDHAVAWEAAEDLCAWIERGGFVPKMPPAVERFVHVVADVEGYDRVS